MFSISRFQQVLQAIPRGAFDRIVHQTGADRYSKGFGSWQHLVVMLYAQLSGCSSLRQLEAGFNAQSGQHYHLGACQVRRSTLSGANSSRTPVVFARLLELLMVQAGRSMRRERQELRYLLDASTLALPYPGRRVNARVRPGLKLHVVMHADSPALAYASITDARVDDKDEARKLQIDRDTLYIFDRGYCDYAWWHEIGCKAARFVTRFKRNAALKVLQELPPVGEAVLRDSIVAYALRSAHGGHRNPSSTLRRIEVQRADAAPLVLATNDLTTPAQEIADAYRQRWQIELLFKWIKQHLQVKRFIGTNENAARIQVLTALIAYMLVMMLKMATGFASSAWMLLAELRVNLFQRPTAESTYWRRRRQLRERSHQLQPILI